MRNYEWDVEEVSAINQSDATGCGYGQGDIIEHYHQETFADCMSLYNTKPPEGSRWEIVLVVDFDNGRGWAYLGEELELPEYFQDACLIDCGKVPKRYVEEVKKYKNKA